MGVFITSTSSSYTGRGDTRRDSKYVGEAVRLNMSFFHFFFIFRVFSIFFHSRIGLIHQPSVLVKACSEDSVGQGCKRLAAEGIIRSACMMYLSIDKCLVCSDCRPDLDLFLCNSASSVNHLEQRHRSDLWDFSLELKMSADPRSQ